MTTQVERAEGVVDAELVLGGAAAASGTIQAYDPAAAAVLAALERGAEEHIEAARPRKTRSSYANDWALWVEFHGWLAERTGTALPLTAVTKGTLVGFTVWLDEVKRAAPNSVDRRITGVTVTARSKGATVPKEATLAARQLVRQYRSDPARMARGRGKAAPVTPADLRRMNTAERTVAPRPAARRGRTYQTPELARLRDRAMNTLRFAIAARNEEVSALDDTGIRLVAEGLEVHVSSVKGRPPRDVVVAYGEHPDTCPVRLWLAWQQAKLASGAAPGGPAFLPVDQWGNLGTKRLSPDGCGRVMTRAAERAGIEDRRITGHSGRRGVVTSGRKRGKRAEKLRAQGGWSPKSPVFWEYIDEGERWEDAATEGIGL
ncbi:hypothetical protein ACFWOL_33900 [Streptomyces sp. NPDC058442]|uniref:hypothetical protein n=1 Tax=Streptomyces sp. NPDC058442 TaxID=3346503 RepID=UPI0036614112